eukprot:gb/GECG01016848.1/.p1 GENE.gb/GECG01016848.1/~~gb/GECG01016848.1/.p1  ORF type:complete len:476 (+),score=44.33 gb/GECG01016848.1/:1-1428(+)
MAPQSHCTPSRQSHSRSRVFSLVLVCLLALIGPYTLAASSANDEPWVSPEMEKTVSTLETDNFDQHISTGRWIIKFYSPNCGHCRRMAPAFHEAAQKASEDSSNAVYFGKVDCLAHRSLCERFNIKAYPTLVIFIDGQSYTIPSEFFTRDVSGLLNLASRVRLGPLKQLGNPQDLKEAFESSPVLFTFIQRHEPTGRSYSLIREASKNVFAASPITAVDVAGGLPDVLQGVVDAESITKLDDNLILCRLEQDDLPIFFPAEAARNGDSRQFSRTTSQLPRDTLEKNKEAVYQWMYRNRLPSMVEMGPGNAGALLNSERLLVLGVFSREDSQFAKRNERFQKFASMHSSYLSESTRASFNFAWIDGNEWANYVSQFNISPNTLPRYVVIDPKDRGYWEDDSVDELDELQSFLDDILADTHPKQRRGLFKYPQKFINILNGYHGVNYQVGVVAGSIAFVIITLVVLVRGCSGKEKNE